MEILIPIVDKDEHDEIRKAFLYKVSARIRPGVEGIEINQDPELTTFIELVKQLIGNNTQIEVNISPVNTSKRLTNITEENIPSMTLGIFLAIENQINNRIFIDNYDYLIVTGDIKKSLLKPIDDEEKKVDAAIAFMNMDSNRNKKAKFIYVKNIKTLSTETNNNIEIVRVHGNTKYEDFMDSIFSITGDSIEYYSSYVDKNGIPFGINKLTKEEVSKTQLSYKFISKDNRLIRVEHINSNGWPCNYSGPIDDPIIQDINYPDDYTIKIKCKTQAGKTEYIKELKPYPRNGNFNRVNFLSADESFGFYLNKNSLDYTSSITSNILGAKAQIRGYLLERNKEGFIAKKKFVRYQGSLDFQADENGIYGFQYILNDIGLPEYEYYIDKLDNKIDTHIGIGGSKFIYDDKGNLLEQVFIRSDGTYVNQRGIGRVKYIRDSFGNVIEESFYDKDNKKILCREGYHKIKNVYKDGHICEAIFLDKYDKEVNSIYGFSRTKNTYNFQGYETKISFFDKQEKPVYGHSEDNRIFSSVEYEYDDRGLRIENRYFDPEGNYYNGASGTEVIKFKYDNKGNIIEDIYCDSKGNLVEDFDNTARLEILYDECDRKISELYYGKNGKLKNTHHGYAIGKFFYDEETGNISCIAFYDENSNPIAPSYFGYHKGIIEYNNEGLEKEVRLYKNENDLQAGICKYTYDYDEKGFITCFKTFNKDNKLQNNEEGYAITNFHKYGDLEYYEFIDCNEILVIKKELSYDKRDSLSKIKIFKGKELEFIECIKREYDACGNIIEEKYTNEEETKLLNNSKGFAKQVFKYDESGNLTVRMFYTSNDTPFEYKGYTRIVNKFDGKGNIIERYAYKKDNSLFEIQDSVFGFQYVYNARNLPSEYLYLGKDKKQIRGDSHGICSLHFDYINETHCHIQFLDFRKRIISEEILLYELIEEEKKRKIQFSNEKMKFEILLNE